MSSTSKELLLVFTRNPELGKCKTRLAAKVGDQAALDIYTFSTPAHRRNNGSATHGYLGVLFRKNC